MHKDTAAVPRQCAAGAAISPGPTSVTLDCLRALYNFDFTPVSSDVNTVGFGKNIYRSENVDLFFGTYRIDQVGHIPTLISVEGGDPDAGGTEAEAELDIELMMRLLGSEQNLSLYYVAQANTSVDPTDRLLAALDGSYCSVAPAGDEGRASSLLILLIIIESKPPVGVPDCGNKPRTNVIPTPTTSTLSSTTQPSLPSYNDSAQSLGRKEASSVNFQRPVGATSVAPGSTTDQPEISTTDFPSGGGFSNNFPRPSWQSAAVQNYLDNFAPDYDASVLNRSGRAYPDVSANGYPILIAEKDRFIHTGGTSASAPIFTSLIAAVNDARIAAGKSSVGFINPALYSDAFAGAFNDVTVGSNPVCTTNGFPAAPKENRFSSDSFPDYMDGDNYRAVRKYLLQRSTALNHRFLDTRSIYVHPGAESSGAMGDLDLKRHKAVLLPFLLCLSVINIAVEDPHDTGDEEIEMARLTDQRPPVGETVTSTFYLNSRDSGAALRDARAHFDVIIKVRMDYNEFVHTQPAPNECESEWEAELVSIWPLLPRRRARPPPRRLRRRPPHSRPRQPPHHALRPWHRSAVHQAYTPSTPSLPPAPTCAPVASGSSYMTGFALLIRDVMNRLALEGDVPCPCSPGPTYPSGEIDFAGSYGAPWASSHRSALRTGEKIQLGLVVALRETASGMGNTKRVLLSYANESTLADGSELLVTASHGSSPRCLRAMAGAGVGKRQPTVAPSVPYLPSPSRRTRSHYARHRDEKALDLDLISHPTIPKQPRPSVDACPPGLHHCAPGDGIRANEVGAGSGKYVYSRARRFISSSRSQARRGKIGSRVVTSIPPVRSRAKRLWTAAPGVRAAGSRIDGSNCTSGWQAGRSTTEGERLPLEARIVESAQVAKAPGHRHESIWHMAAD
ncbi:hypothetical protein B0H19DRAFT_1275322 [Mycena capillaripes]|nr:hypothetical protein B0H19DRAFT_1275322 [Mycena capillaripes]